MGRGLVGGVRGILVRMLDEDSQVYVGTGRFRLRKHAVTGVKLEVVRCREPSSRVWPCGCGCWKKLRPGSLMDYRQAAHSPGTGDCRTSGRTEKKEKGLGTKPCVKGVGEYFQRQPVAGVTLLSGKQYAIFGSPAICEYGYIGTATISYLDTLFRLLLIIISPAQFNVIGSSLLPRTSSEYIYTSRSCNCSL